MFKAICNDFLKCRNVSQQLRSATSTVDVFLNGKQVSVPSYYTVLQALRSHGVTTPSFCYHERLSIAGNCRMCLIELEGMLKPQVACAINVTKGMKIRTNSPMILQAQESVLEFLLVEHPLDCPICDQGGECDLQDLAMRFGNDRTRFTDLHFEGKRAVENKTLSNLIRCEMNRCIHCTRCIRFASQVCGMEVLGSTGRGADMLVGTYVDKSFFSELSGNIIDLCPVGALTSIPYMFKGRPWELKKTNSIDCTDATGTNIIVDHRFDRVLRVLPREHDEINQEWISDKGRWAIDSLEIQRLVTPMKRVESKCCPIEWDGALKAARDLIKGCPPEAITAVAGPHTNAETLVTCKDFLNMLGCENTYIEREVQLGLGADLKTGYCLNVNMKDIVNADKILFIGTNPRFEAPILNAWIREAYRNNECDIFVVGPQCEYNYYVEYIGKSGADIEGAGKYLKGAKKPLIFVGVSQMKTNAANTLLKNVYKLAKSLQITDSNWGVVNIITREASFAGALEAGWKTGLNQSLQKSPPSVLISLGADDMFYDWTEMSNCEVIYIGFQGDKGAECANLILPGSAYTESGGIYLNMEGRSQFALPAVTPPGKARHDWKIIRALAEYCKIRLFYSDHSSLCTRMAQISPNFERLGNYQQKLFPDLVEAVLYLSSKDSSSVASELVVDLQTMKDYYCTDIFTFNSPTMIKTKKAAQAFENHAYAAI